MLMLFQPFCDFGYEVGDGDSLLLHAVALAEGHCVVFEGVEINGDAKWCSEFVLAAVPFADGARFVVFALRDRLELVKDFKGFFGQRLFFHEREHGDFDGGDAGREVENGAHFAVFQFLLFVGVAKKGQDGPFHAECGFDDVRNELFLRDGVGVLEVGA